MIKIIIFIFLCILIVVYYNILHVWLMDGCVYLCVTVSRLFLYVSMNKIFTDNLYWKVLIMN